VIFIDSQVKKTWLNEGLENVLFHRESIAVNYGFEILFFELIIYHVIYMTGGGKIKNWGNFDQTYHSIFITLLNL